MQPEFFISAPRQTKGTIMQEVVEEARGDRARVAVRG